MTLGQRISLCRKQRGMTQEELGEKLGVSRQAVSKWEGDQTTPDLQYLKIMCEEFGVTADWLLFEKDMNQRPEGVDNRPVMEYCPNCGEQVSGGIAFCPKCGQSMAPIDRSGCYTLVLSEQAGSRSAVYDAIREVSAQDYAWKGHSMSYKEIGELLNSAPVVYLQGLDGEQVQDVLRRFIGCSDALEIYRDESAQKTLEELKESGAVPLAASAFRKKSENSGLGFWGVVGAVALAILIMSFL